jgi:peptidoglycan/xylan/chitin deacetylase (PgdA/CDA1 family)
MVAEGHIVGNHSYHHDANHALSNEGMKDMDLAEEAICRVAGVEPRLYRPPHGRKSPWELYHAAHDHMVVVTWNVSGNELRAKDAESFAESIVKKTKPGSIIDLHDGYGNDHRTPQADKSLLVESLPLIIEALQNEGYSFVTVPELLGQPAYNPVAPEKWETTSPTH